MPKADPHHIPATQASATHERGTSAAAPSTPNASGRNALALALLKADARRRLDILEHRALAAARTCRAAETAATAGYEEENRLQHLILASPAASLPDAVVQVHAALIEIWTAESCDNAADMLPPVMAALRSALGVLAPAAGVNLAELGDMPPSAPAPEAVA